MKVFIAGLGGSEPVTIYDLEGSDTVAELKRKITCKGGPPAEKQRLVYAGRVLADEATLSDSNVLKESTITLYGDASDEKRGSAASSSLPTSDYITPNYTAPEYKASDYTAPKYEAPKYTAGEYKAAEYKATDYKAKEYIAPNYSASNASASPDPKKE